MKESNTPCGICEYKATTKESLTEHHTALNEGVKYPCGKYEYQATKKGSLAKHQGAVHERFKYHCGNCDYQATTKGSLAEHQRVVHEGVKYPCGQCDYQASHIGHLAEHQRAVHERVKYPSAGIYVNQSAVNPGHAPRKAYNRKMSKHGEPCNAGRQACPSAPYPWTLSGHGPSPWWCR